MESDNSFYSDNYSFENESFFGDSVEDSQQSDEDNIEKGEDLDNENSSEIEDLMFEI